MVCVRLASGAHKLYLDQDAPYQKLGAALRRIVLALCLCLISPGSLAADELPIRIDSSRNGAVFIKSVDSGGAFQKISSSTPATYASQPGERVDVRVVAEDGWFRRWEGRRQNLSGPSNITIRLEKGLAWERIAVAIGLAVMALLGALFRLRSRSRKAGRVAEQKMQVLENRAKEAEKVGALAKTLGEYKILEKLGAGAMGVVYKVRSPRGEILAAKVPNEVDERVGREADVSASLNSENIVKSYGLVDGDPPFLLMEYMDGETLHEWLETNHRPSLEIIDTLVSQVLSGLETAHQAGVFHRDIKPENLFLLHKDGELQIKIMDFGLASSINAARLTRTGEAMGTPVYASPEQLSGESISATTDLYSVGVLIYELATGVLPWNQTDPVALLVKKSKELPPEPKSKREDLPPAWNELVMDLLKPDPSSRPQTVSETQKRWSTSRS